MERGDTGLGRDAYGPPRRERDRRGYDPGRYPADDGYLASADYEEDDAADSGRPVDVEEDDYGQLLRRPGEVPPRQRLRQSGRPYPGQPGRFPPGAPPNGGPANDGVGHGGMPGGGPHGAMPHAGPPQAGLSHAGPPHAGPTHAGPSHAGSPRSGPQNASPQSGGTHAGPPNGGPHDGPPHGGPMPGGERMPNAGPPGGGPGPGGAGPRPGRQYRLPNGRRVPPNADRPYRPPGPGAPAAASGRHHGPGPAAQDPYAGGRSRPGPAPVPPPPGPGRGGAVPGAPPLREHTPAGPRFDGPEGRERPIPAPEPPGLVIRQREAAVPDRPADPAQPVASIAPDGLEAFARDLRALRATANLDYPEMAEVSHYEMKTLAAAAGGLRLPTLPVAVAFVRACDGNVGEWEERWQKLAEKITEDAARKRRNDGEDDGDPVEPANAPVALEPPAPKPTTPPPDSESGEVYVITSAKPRQQGR